MCAGSKKGITLDKPSTNTAVPRSMRLLESNMDLAETKYKS